VPAIFERTACHWLNNSHMFRYVIVGHPSECEKLAGLGRQRGRQRWNDQEAERQGGGKRARARARIQAAHRTDPWRARALCRRGMKILSARNRDARTR